ncbi:Transcriptional regulator, LysR family [Pseudomonas sp. R4-39-08]|nr:Transcriptional regulator, LysR family [Pseudomonas sp. R4-39-08]
MAIRFSTNWRVLCASPDYLARYGEPQKPADLDNQKLIVLMTSAGPLNTFHFVVDGHGGITPCP